MPPYRPAAILFTKMLTMMIVDYVKMTIAAMLFAGYLSRCAAQHGHFAACVLGAPGIEAGY